MNEMTSITARIDAKTRAMVHDAANARGMSEEDFAAEAIRRLAESEADYRVFIQEGTDAADRGELLSQEEMEAWFEERIGTYRARATAQ